MPRTSATPFFRRPRRRRRVRFMPFFLPACCRRRRHCEDAGIPIRQQNRNTKIDLRNTYRQIFSALNVDYQIYHASAIIPRNIAAGEGVERAAHLKSHQYSKWRISRKTATAPPAPACVTKIISRNGIPSPVISPHAPKCSQYQTTTSLTASSPWREEQNAAAKVIHHARYVNKRGENRRYNAEHSSLSPYTRHAPSSRSCAKINSEIPPTMVEPSPHAAWRTRHGTRQDAHASRTTSQGTFGIKIK